MIKKYNFSDFNKNTQSVIEDVGVVLQIVDYKNIFNTNSKGNIDLRYICYTVYFELGKTYQFVGDSFFRNHSSIIQGIKKVINSPILTERTNLVLNYIKSKNKIVNNFNVSSNNSISAMLDFVDFFNQGETVEDIKKRMGLNDEDYNLFILKVLNHFEIKKLPDYKNHKTKEIFIQKRIKLCN